MSVLNDTRKRARRRGYLVSCYVGPNGSGKSACMVRDCLPSLEAGRPILSTVRLQDYENPRPCDDDWCASNPEVLDHYRLRPTAEGRAAIIRNQRALFFYGPNARQEPVEMQSAGVHLAAHPLWIPWTNFEQMRTLKFGEVLADEITGVADARAWAALPQIISSQLQQLRRADIPFRYTSPSWDQADVNLRRPTQTVTLCRGYMPAAAPTEETDVERVVRIRRLYRWQTYDAFLLTQLDEGKRKDLKPEVVEWHWGPKSVAWRAYDTFAPVLTVGNPHETGVCHKCGGRRPDRPKCSCPPADALRGAAVIVGLSARRGDEGSPSTHQPTRTDEPRTHDDAAALVHDGRHRGGSAVAALPNL